MATPACINISFLSFLWSTCSKARRKLISWANRNKLQINSDESTQNAFVNKKPSRFLAWCKLLHKNTLWLRFPWSAINFIWKYPDISACASFPKKKYFLRKIKRFSQQGPTEGTKQVENDRVAWLDFLSNDACMIMKNDITKYNDFIFIFGSLDVCFHHSCSRHFNAAWPFQ